MKNEGPFSGIAFEPAFSQKKFLVNPQAQTVWRWVQQLRSELLPGQRLLLMNMDETGIPLFMGNCAGNVHARVRSLKSTQPQQKERTQHATRHQLRGQITHAAIIADDLEIQRLLPQVLVGDHHLLPARTVTALRDALPANVRLLRLKSRWMDAPLMQAILREIALVLRGRPNIKPVLLLDCCPAHLQEPVLRTAKACRINLIFIPAKFTWLLQPCDTGVFHRYKQCLQRRYSELRRDSAAGMVDQEDWWRVIIEEANAFVAQRSWSHVFAGNGFHGVDARLSSYIRNQMEWQEIPPLEPGMPSLADLQTVLPKGRQLKWGLVLPRAREPLRLGAPASSSVALLSGPRSVEPCVSSPAAAVSAPASSSSEWLIPRAMPLPPLPPPATPPLMAQRRSLSSRDGESTQPAQSAATTAAGGTKRARTTVPMFPGTSSTASGHEPISARTRSRSFEHNTNT